jgi:U4/U6.U5 tri-snRNP-associated protein 3
MAEMLGITGFGSTKGKEVEDNVKGAGRGAARASKRRKYRQYMNRRGGFNRLLAKMP